jgi:hypothetical protein
MPEQARDAISGRQGWGKGHAGSWSQSSVRPCSISPEGLEDGWERGAELGCMGRGGSQKEGLQIRRRCSHAMRILD